MNILPHEEPKSLLRWAAVGGLAVLLLWILSGFVLLRFFPLPSQHGPLGDSFGAINALFSGWAFLGVVLAIALQRQELQLQRQELRLARDAHERSADALRSQEETAKYRAELESLNLLIRSCERQLESVRHVSSTAAIETKRRLERRVRQYEEQLEKVIEPTLGRLNDT